MQNLKPILSRTFKKSLTLISPRLNTKVLYRIKFKRKLNLTNPTTLNEKILCLKLGEYWNNPVIKQCADKYRVREYIQAKGMSNILNDLLAVYDNADAIDWDSLPKSFVIKLNTGCGCNIVVRDKKNLDIEETISTIKKWLCNSNEYWKEYSEIQYKDVKPYILFERYIGSPNESLPEDYKFYCMNGKCVTTLVCKDRVIGKRARYFFMDPEWNLLPYTEEALESPREPIPLPHNYQEAVNIAETLSKDFPFVRVDLFLTEDKIYFGELTFTPAAGMDIELKLTPPPPIRECTRKSCGCRYYIGKLPAFRTALLRREF